MEMHQEQQGCVYRRVPGCKRHSRQYERRPAIKIAANNGSVLLKPQPAQPKTDNQAYMSYVLAEGVIVYLAAEPQGRPPAPAYAQSAAQGSHLFIGMGKHASVGRKFE